MHEGFGFDRRAKCTSLFIGVPLACCTEWALERRRSRRFFPGIQPHVSLVNLYAALDLKSPTTHALRDGTHKRHPRRKQALPAKR